ncbi:Protease 1 precursor [compost metagenome]
MKKSLLIGAVLFSTIYSAQAQISQGGLPLSLRNKVSYSNIPLSSYSNPDWNAYLEQASADFNQPYLAGLYTAANFGFPESGQLITLDNGQRIWRGQIRVQDAPAIGLMYDKFALPKGVQLYLSNETQNQVLGAFDAANNDPSGVFVTDAVQGGLVNVELNIDAAVHLSDIQLHVDKAIVFHRAIEHLAQYTIGGGQTIASAIDSALVGASSVCMINAICPQGDGYSRDRKATVQTLLPAGNGAALCSGTLVNTTANSTANCSKPYILTASHCEGTGSLSNTTFNQILVRFNFEKSACAASSQVPTAQSMTGANVIARANYNESFSTSDIKGDFLLLQLRQTVPASYNAIVAGWNNNPAISRTTSAPKKFIGFHHPAGDAKKTSYTYTIGSTDLGSGVSNTHWEMMLQEGYVAGGSSGSGLFNPDGYLIGIASVAGEANPPSSCHVNARGQVADVYAMNWVTYSRFSFDWDYSIDGTANNRKLKPWLDPNNTGAATVESLNAADCSNISGTGINTVNKDLSDNVTIYPNPVISDNVQLQYNLPNTGNLYITVYDVSGKTVYQTEVLKTQSGVRKLDLGNLPNGMYLVKVATEAGFTTKKVMIQK